LAALKLLNLGCGNRFHPAWTNVDFVSTNSVVIAYDLNKGINYPDASYDVVYHSHLLEHFAKNDAERFISECFRVLRPGGIVRVAVPDLEKLAKIYLETLENACDGVTGQAANYEWIMLHLYDQTVRSVEK
jgi:predicted SAM-dependent methyltransferase